jgi:FHA domain
MSRRWSRFGEQAEPRARRSAANNNTCGVVWSSEDEVDFRGLFLTHYPRIRESCLGVAEAGIAVFAISQFTGWAGSMFLESQPEKINVGLLGRHSAADLFLVDPCVALRHLVFLVTRPSWPRDALGSMVRFRVLDLNTGSPPIDEEGRAVESLTATGPVFLVCQGHALMTFVTGDPDDWPESADEAWRRLPDRVFVEERLAPSADGPAPTPDSDAQAPGSARKPRRITVVLRESGPAPVTVRQDGGDEPVRAQLTITSPDGNEVLLVGHESLRRGLLVGRYERCDAGGQNADDKVGMSRVHALVIESDGVPHAIDLGSTNGTYVYCAASEGFVAFRVVPLHDGDIIALGSTDTCLGWNTIEQVPPDDSSRAPAVAEEKEEQMPYANDPDFARVLETVRTMEKDDLLAVLHAHFHADCEHDDCDLSCSLELVWANGRSTPGAVSTETARTPTREKPMRAMTAVLPLRGPEVAFWQEVFLTSLRGGLSYEEAATLADRVIQEFRARMPEPDDPYP